MRFASRSSPGQHASLREAVLAGLAPDGGLYHPVDIPDLSRLFASFDDTVPFTDLAAEVLAVLMQADMRPDRARRLARGALDFPVVLRRLDERMLLLELFHGPTCAFKDFGARFLAAAMEHFLGEERRRIQILVATSGDTGGAVASAFHGRAGIDVVILYPRGRVSDLQEKQLTTLGGNVHALEVDGSFDDCQRLAKEAFQDAGLRSRLGLTSANSINIGRLLPQTLYYIYACTRRAELGGALPTICVPSGNFGNLTAGVYAWRWGLPLAGFIAATNANDVVPAYLSGGRFDPRPSKATLSNAMDVGNPSNFERLREVFKDDWRGMASRIEGRSVSDDRTVQTMRRVHEEHGLHVDPHTAVGCAAAWDHMHGQGESSPEPAPAAGRAAPPVGGGAPIIVLSTAHPAKFADVVRAATGSVPEMPERLARCLALPKRAQSIPPRLPALSEFLLDSFA